ncbi:hypothetical protein B0A49_05036 [Cryomyces minteri]|uniref:Major facilitator superfamily (MFS) profile domain-containing protein n=1 Tax=Cryomyces minteri TaxID=331657 RepID=A0A4U0XJ63_9PEZI|nr:hypothetical protein B0A49_05036 [Cryomyces minteri]
MSLHAADASEKSLEKPVQSHIYSVPPSRSATSPEFHEDDDDDSSDGFSIHSIPGSELTPHISRQSIRLGAGPRLSRRNTNASVMTTDPAFEVDWDPDTYPTKDGTGDRFNPRIWTLWYRSLIIFFMSFATTTVVLYSSSYSSAIPGMKATFGISDSTGILGITTYLLGMAVGSVILAPLSEMYGRRPIYLIALALFTLLVLPCALAPNIEAILVTRFFGAFAASAMISNAPGTINDISEEEYRALAFSIWSIGPMNGPVIGPLVGGFVYQYLGWRWTNWVVMIMAGAAFFMVALVPETYAPAILRSRAAKKRKETDEPRWWSRYDEKKDFWPLLKVNLSRPFIMTVTEPICIFWDVYIAIVYGILYLCFVAYPIVFQGLRGWASGFTGLAFCGIGCGSLIVIASEPLIRKIINSHKPDPETGKPPPEAMISVVCGAAILIPVGELIFAWTCTPNVHWIWPILAGIPFGMGNCTVFIYASNYLVHSYGIYAASALAGNSVLRSVLGGTIPLAGPAMYHALGANWAGTTLGLLEAVCIPIPFIFYKYGHRIRMKSTLIRTMQEDKDRLEGKRRKMEERAEERAEADAMAGAGMESGAAVYEERDIEMGMGKEEKT